jgi:transposase
MRVARFTAQFKAEAIKQVIDRGHSVVDVSKRLGVSDKSLCLWLRQAKEPPGAVVGDIAALKLELAHLKAELKRASEGRDILKKAAAYFARASE